MKHCANKIRVLPYFLTKRQPYLNIFCSIYSSFCNFFRLRSFVIFVICIFSFQLRIFLMLLFFIFCFCFMIYLVFVFFIFSFWFRISLIYIYIYFSYFPFRRGLSRDLFFFIFFFWLRIFLIFIFSCFFCYSGFS